MKRLILILFIISTYVIHVRGQVNLLSQVGLTKQPFGLSLGEDARSVFIVRKYVKNFPSSYSPENFAPLFIMHRLDKNNPRIINSKIIAGDTLQVDSALNNFTFRFIIEGSRIHFFYTKLFLKDTSQSNFYRRYWTGLYYQQLDTALSVIVPERRLLLSMNTARFGDANSTSICASQNKVACAYRLGDSTSNSSLSLSKCMILDLGGNIILDDSIPVKNVVGIANHAAENVYSMPGGGWLFQGHGLLSAFADRGYVITDSSLHLLDTFSVKPFYLQHNNLWNGYFGGGGLVSSTVLPSGNIFISGILDYMTFNSSERMPAIGKMNRLSNFSIDSFIEFGRLYPNDLVHTNYPAYQSIAYNKIDNRIYFINTTNSSPFGCNSVDNSFEVISVDTNLSHAWRKSVVRSDTGYCIYATGISSCVGRSGVIVSGMQVLSSNQADTSYTSGFVYRVDSNSNLDVVIPHHGRPAENRFLIYPNPVTDFIIIQDFRERQNEIFLYDFQGKIIKHQYHCGQIFKLDISEAPCGIYLLRIEANDGEMYLQKITKR